MSGVPFERYDEEFLSLTEQVQTSITHLQNSGTKSGSVGSPKSPESELKLAQGLLSQCEELLKQMQIESRSVDDASAKKELQKKVRVCKARLLNLRDDFNSAKTSVERGMLLSGSSSVDVEAGSRGSTLGSDHRERLINTSDQISSQNDTLNNARRVMADTEEVALEITSELGRNREKIQSAHGRVRDVSGLTNHARRIVSSMSRREVQQKLIMYMVAALLVGTVLVILYAMSK
mmetsp:Transcript_46291/g.68272  ORF Transcript_46291/g.68272 Transcript_46291/m.68272 type:complete len:234 (+) Transcript_46291:170-871(+)|eukprot:CAMPEP_0195514638 /NCGR_PEP_ID=MMETSP0794_2-20130614/5963_1 /TAXON_ID=515487 /ORGANISM="Stephanopyxis turris, Strain CCMP 815" /LENGTH=233 /DNA_ID=CAMNT_0040642919 /DNA_START=135 /DNA_END=836 /DNA_ORIENTATION=-